MELFAYVATEKHDAMMRTYTNNFAQAFTDRYIDDLDIDIPCTLEDYHASYGDRTSRILQDVKLIGQAGLLTCTKSQSPVAPEPKSSIDELVEQIGRVGKMSHAPKARSVSEGGRGSVDLAIAGPDCIPGNWPARSGPHRSRN